MAKTRVSVIDDRMGRKKFEDIRVFVRDLFINGFRDRNGLNALADNKRRAADESRQIIASILRDYYRFEKSGSERYLIAIDTRDNRHNPIHNVWKSKTFSGSDIIMHFYILDYLSQLKNTNVDVTSESIFQYLQTAAARDEEDNALSFESASGEERLVWESLTLSKLNVKLLEMTELGLIERTRKNKKGYAYSLSPSFEIDSDLLNYASEVMPVSTVGSYLLDRQECDESVFTFKHNMISQVLDDDVMYMLFKAMHEHREMSLQLYNRKTKRYFPVNVVPLFILRNVQTGRQYLACWSVTDSRFKPLRLDYIRIEKNTANKHRYMGAEREDYSALREECRSLYRHSWGINLYNTAFPPKLVSFTIQLGDNEKHIARRLYREKRGGKVEDLGSGRYRFSMELYDSIEILPWIATFYGYITELEIEDEKALEKLKGNFEAMLHNHVRDKIALEV